MGSDRITLTGITAVGHHGVLEFEKREGQTFRVDAELTVDLRAAGRSDALADTVSYVAIAELIEEAITGEPYDLIEALAEGITAGILAADRRITAAEVTVHKPHAPLTQSFADVSVTVHRDQESHQEPHQDSNQAAASRISISDLRDPDLGADFPVRSVLALGSNLGDSAQTLDAALDALATAEKVDVVRTSPRAITAPVGGPEGQPNFLNQVVEVETSLSPHGLLDLAQSIEAQQHRSREVHWGPRTLDVDLITYAGAHIDSPRLQIPHPRAAERAFVLAPWSWMDPIALLDGASVRELAAQAADVDGVRRAQETGP